MHTTFTYDTIEMNRTNKEGGSNFINHGQIAIQLKWKKYKEVGLSLVAPSQITLNLKQRKQSLICSSWIA
jgi:hypothetical protein